LITAFELLTDDLDAA